MSNLKTLNKKAVQNIEEFVLSCRPQERQDLKAITKELATAAIGAMIAVHNVTEILKYLESIKNFAYAHELRDVTIH